jgi:short-subunit dehydrogenase
MAVKIEAARRHFKPAPLCYTAGTMNDWALLTGASSGIGLELARRFAADRVHLALVARNESRLNRVADELRAGNGIQVKVLAADLSSPSAPAAIFEAMRGTPVSVLVNNAGLGQYGAFARSDLRLQTEIMQVNMTALVQLTHLFLQPMLQRGSGRILNVASTAAFLPGPMVNVYYASKAFVYSFSCALAAELAGTGVTVTTLCPGSTRTEFFERAGMHMAGGWPMMDSRRVAAAGYRGLMQGRRLVIPGLTNRIAAAIAQLAPARVTTAVVRRIHEQSGPK